MTGAKLVLFKKFARRFMAFQQFALGRQTFQPQPVA
jgi:hypothetical protein